MNVSISWCSLPVSYCHCFLHFIRVADWSLFVFVEFPTQLCQCKTKKQKERRAGYQNDCSADGGIRHYHHPSTPPLEQFIGLDCWVKPYYKLQLFYSSPARCIYPLAQETNRGIVGPLDTRRRTSPSRCCYRSLSKNEKVTTNLKKKKKTRKKREPKNLRVSTSGRC